MLKKQIIVYFTCCATILLFFYYTNKYTSRIKKYLFCTLSFCLKTLTKNIFYKHSTLFFLGFKIPEAHIKQKKTVTDLAYV